MPHLSHHDLAAYQYCQYSSADRNPAIHGDRRPRPSFCYADHCQELLVRGSRFEPWVKHLLMWFHTLDRREAIVLPSRLRMAVAAINTSPSAKAIWSKPRIRPPAAYKSRTDYPDAHRRRGGRLARPSRRLRPPTWSGERCRTPNTPHRTGARGHRRRSPRSRRRRPLRPIRPRGSRYGRSPPAARCVSGEIAAFSADSNRVTRAEKVRRMSASAAACSPSPTTAIALPIVS